MACLALRMQATALAFGSSGGSINLSQSRSSSSLSLSGGGKQPTSFPAFGRGINSVEASSSKRSPGELCPSVADEGQTSSFATADAVRGLIANSSDRADSRWYGGLFGLPEVDWAGVLPDSSSSLKQPEPLCSERIPGGSHGEAVPKTMRIEAKNATTGAVSGNVIVQDRGSRQPVFTAEKAKLLRREMRKHEAWHDTMYHSGTASRLAVADQ